MRVVKVAGENLTKMIDITDLEYEQFKKRLHTEYTLQQDKCYHLFSNDVEKVSILSEEDYKFLKENCNIKKLILEKTDNPKLHFDGNISSVSTANQNNEELQTIAKELKQSIQSRLQ